MKDVAGKVAFVTGAASGMGLTMARSFAAAGMKVVLADIEEEALERARASFGPTNADVIAIRVDVTDREAMAAAADRTEEAFGKVHVLCNNAGVAVSGSIADMAYTDWDWVVGVNLDGVVNGVQTFLPRILAHGEGGHIVNTASLAGLLPFARLGVYNTTKFAVVGMSEALRADLAERNVGVSRAVSGCRQHQYLRFRPQPSRGAAVGHRHGSDIHARPRRRGDSGAPPGSTDERSRTRRRRRHGPACHPEGRGLHLHPPRVRGGRKRTPGGGRRFVRPLAGVPGASKASEGGPGLLPTRSQSGGRRT